MTSSIMKPFLLWRLWPQSKVTGCFTVFSFLAPVNVFITVKQHLPVASCIVMI